MLHSRIQRIEELIKEEVGKIIQFEMKDPRLQFVTVCRAKVSKDLRHAIIFVSFLDDDKADDELRALEGAKGFIRKCLSDRVVLKFLPDLKFIRDENAAYAVRISKLIDEVTEQSSPAADAESSGPEETAPNNAMPEEESATGGHDER